MIHYFCIRQIIFKPFSTQAIPPEPAQDFCLESPCENNGVCHNGTDSYICKCSGLWGGVNCTEGTYLSFSMHWANISIAT